MFSHRQGIFEETIKIFKSRKIPQLQSGQTSPVWEDDDVSFGDRVVSHILHRIFSFCSQLHSCPNQDEALLVEWLPSHYSGALEDRKAGAEVVESTLVALRDPQEEARTWSTAPWAHTAVSAAPLGSLGEKLKPFPLSQATFSHTGTTTGAARSPEGIWCCRQGCVVCPAVPC